MNLRERITAALDASIDRCARCKTCGEQVDAVMTVVLVEIEDRVRLARRLDTLDRMQDLGAPEIILANQRRMVLETMEKLGEVPDQGGPDEVPDC
jgi:hypothetical protein